jgi:LytS/YehU family sensor histidine kinase
MFAPITHTIPSMALAKPAASVWEAIWQRAGMSYAANLLVFAAIALAYLVVASAYDVRKREREAAQLEAKLARSELELLKMQLQPHFVFNTLQTASALIAYNVADARRVLATLGSLLRFSLDNLGTNEITLNEEVAVLQQYLDIQHARFKERLRVRIDVDASAERVLVPALLLQPIVENAIRHGVEQRSGGGSIVVHAVRASGRLTIAVTDDGPGLKPAMSLRETNGSGVGLANVRARLKQLYGDAARLVLANGAGGGCELTVEMPAREAGDGGAG